jgi:hypothetical protein
MPSNTLNITLIKGDDFVNDAVDYRDAIPVNMYGINKQILGAAGYMKQMYGIDAFGTGYGIDRGGIWCAREGLEGHYRVSGNSFISVSTTGETTVLGTIGGTGQCRIFYTFKNLVIVGDLKLFYWNPADGFREITSNGVVGKPIDGVFNSNFVFLTDGDDIYHNTLADEEVFLASDSAEPDFTPDKVFGVATNEDNEVVVFSEFSIQHYITVAKTNFSFQNLPRKTSKLGTLGTFCQSELEGTYYILGRREETAPSCFMYSMGTGTKIASREIELVLKEYTDDELNTTTIDAFTADKTQFVIYHFPRSTYLFNATVAKTHGPDNAWTKLKTGTVGDLPFRARNMVRDPRNGEWLCGDINDSRIGLLSNETSTQYGEIAEWLLFTPYLMLERKSIDRFEIQIIPGIVSPDDDATVFVSRTEDGRTYGQEWTELYGNAFQYNQRFIIRRFGYVRHWMGFKLRGASRSRMAFGLFTLDIS